MNQIHKAEAIRLVLQEVGGEATFKEIESRLKLLNVTASPQQVSNEKRKLLTLHDINDLPVSVLKKVKSLVEELGSVEIIRRALDELELLQAKK